MQNNLLQKYKRLFWNTFQDPGSSPRVLWWLFSSSYSCPSTTRLCLVRRYESVASALSPHCQHQQWKLWEIHPKVANRKAITQHLTLSPTTQKRYFVIFWIYIQYPCIIYHLKDIKYFVICWIYINTPV